MSTQHGFEAIRFLKQFGFAEDPFASTNAADEPNLSDYFVEPPYFASVMGDPARPKSHVVLAPRGGGKTAQRRMIEDASQQENILCLTYDTFDLRDRFKLSDATWEYHVEQVARLILVGVLAHLVDNEPALDAIDKDSKAHLGVYVHRFLGSMTEDQFSQAVQSIKSRPEKATEFVRRFSGPLTGLVGAVMKFFGLPTVEVKAAKAEQMRGESLRLDLQRLIGIARQAGFDSVYVLVDRVDEIPQTSVDAAKTFQFIQSLVTDLPTLELDGAAFKFFLWDLIEQELRSSGGRPDRVPIFTLAWSANDLEQMISRRLYALSGQKVSRLTELFCPGLRLNADALMAHLAGGSPRDLIRMMARVVAEQTRTTDNASCIGEKALWDGIRHFSDERAQELIPRYLADIRRIGARGQVTFTNNQLASDVFRISVQAARSKIQKWEQTGLIAQIGELPNPGNRPMHLYGAIDVRLAIAMLRTSSPEEIIGNYVLFCPQCHQLVISDRDQIVCPACNHEFGLNEAASLLEQMAE